MPFRTNLKPSQISNHGKQLQVGWSSYSLRKLTFSSPRKNMLTPRIKHPQYLATSNGTLRRAHLGTSIPCGRLAKLNQFKKAHCTRTQRDYYFLAQSLLSSPCLSLECPAGIISPSLGISLTDSSTGTLHQRRAHLTAALSPAKLVHPAVHFSWLPSYVIVCLELLRTSPR